MREQITEPLAMAKANPDCMECNGLGTVRRYIGHEGRGAIFPCVCLRDQALDALTSDAQDMGMYDQPFTNPLIR